MRAAVPTESRSLVLARMQRAGQRALDLLGHGLFGFFRNLALCARQYLLHPLVLPFLLRYALVATGGATSR
eukprot:scaffold7620_cov484-Prasinococcus_capsulatus_cf.AAC.4